jgi:hypothetical protein
MPDILSTGEFAGDLKICGLPGLKYVAKPRLGFVRKISQNLANRPSNVLRGRDAIHGSERMVDGEIAAVQNPGCQGQPSRN